MALNIRGGPKELGGAGFIFFKNTRGQHFLKSRERQQPTEDMPCPVLAYRVEALLYQIVSDYKY